MSYTLRWWNHLSVSVQHVIEGALLVVILAVAGAILLYTFQALRPTTSVAPPIAGVPATVDRFGALDDYALRHPAPLHASDRAQAARLDDYALRHPMRQITLAGADHSRLDDYALRHPVVSNGTEGTPDDYYLRHR
jgi:hypothetical protein